jgi:hypothetical protein
MAERERNEEKEDDREKESSSPNHPEPYQLESAKPLNFE